MHTLTLTFPNLGPNPNPNPNLNLNPNSTQLPGALPALTWLVRQWNYRVAEEKYDALLQGQPAQGGAAAAVARFRSWHEKAIANDGQPYFIRWDNREMSRYGPQIDDADTGTYGLENPNPNPHSIPNPSPSPGPHPDQAHMGSRCLTCRAPPRRSLPRCDNPDPASTRATRRDCVEIAHFRSRWDRDRAHPCT